MEEIRVRLISWNLHGTPFGTERRRERMDAAGEEILRRLPDVVLLQEIWLAGDCDRLVEQLAPAYVAVDTARRVLWVREGGLLALVRRSGNWEVESSEFLRFEAEASAWKIWEADGLGNKGVQRIVLRHAEARLVLLNTHLQAEYLDSDYSAIRRRQLGQLRQIAAEVDQRRPVLAAGDLNTTPGEPLYADITDFWHDLGEEARRDCRCGTQARGEGMESEWIDYVLARKSGLWRFGTSNLELIRSTRPDHPYSDHHGVDATIRLRASVNAGLAATGAAQRLLSGPSTRREWLLGLLYLATSRRA